MKSMGRQVNLQSCSALLFYLEARRNFLNARVLILVLKIEITEDCSNR